MSRSLEVGLEHELRFRVPESKTVPALYREAPEFQEMPHVFATGFLVGLLEWACIEALKAHLDWPREQSVGTHIDVSHCAATPPGLEVHVKVKLVVLDRRRLVFEVQAHDGIELISKGLHERFIVDSRRFAERTKAKVQAQRR